VSAPARAGGARLRRRRAVLSTELERESILLDPESGTYYTLNEIGSRVWELAADRPTLDEVHDILLTEYEIDAETLRRDLETLLDRLEAEDLMDVDEG
jgi:hypothetical protein